MYKLTVLLTMLALLTGSVWDMSAQNTDVKGRVTDKAILGVTDYDQDGEDELIVFDLYDSIHVVRRNDMLPSEYQHMLITYESEGYHVDFYCDAGYQYPWTEGMTEYWDGHRKVPITYIYMYAAKNNGPDEEPSAM